MRLEAIELKKSVAALLLRCFFFEAATAVLRASKQPKRPEAIHPLLCFIEAVKQKQPLWINH